MAAASATTPTKSRCALGTAAQMNFRLVQKCEPEMVVGVHRRCSRTGKFREANSVAQPKKDERNKKRCGGPSAEVVHGCSFRIAAPLK